MTSDPRAAPEGGRFLDPTTPPRIGTLVVLTGVAAMAMNVFLPSLPGMAAEFGVSYGVMQLSVALFLGTNVALQIVLGPLSDRFGRRPVMLAAYATFCLSSLGCALATRIEVFLAFRMLQATAFAGVLLARAMIRDMVPREQAASMIGYVTMGMAMVPMVSPAIGGLLDETLGWRASFWLMLILGLAVMVLIWRDLGETHFGRPSSLAEQVRSYPELFRSPRFWGYAAAAGFGGGTFFSYIGGAPYVGREIFGLAPATLGLFFGVASLGYATGNFLSGRLSVRMGVDRMVLTGATVMAGALALSLALVLAGLGSAVSFFGLMAVVGVGNGMVLPNATSGFLSVRPHLAGTASGLGGALTIGLGAALTALAGTVLGPVHGAATLIAMQLAAALGAVAAILLTIRRARRRGLG